MEGFPFVVSVVSKHKFPPPFTYSEVKSRFKDRVDANPNIVRDLLIDIVDKKEATAKSVVAFLQEHLKREEDVTIRLYVDVL